MALTAHEHYATDPAFELKIEEVIKRDGGLSKRTPDTNTGNHYYQMRSTLGSVAKGTRWSIPAAVAEYRGSLG